MPWPLTTNIVAGQTGHPAIHNDTRGTINEAGAISFDQVINHSVAGPLQSIDCNNGHTILVDLTANVTAFSGFTGIRAGRVPVLAFRTPTGTAANPTVNLADLDAAHGDTLGTITVFPGGCRLVSLWSDDWASYQYVVGDRVIRPGTQYGASPAFAGFRSASSLTGSGAQTINASNLSGLTSGDRLIFATVAIYPGTLTWTLPSGGVDVETFPGAATNRPVIRVWETTYDGIATSWTFGVAENINTCAVICCQGTGSGVVASAGQSGSSTTIDYPSTLLVSSGDLLIPIAGIYNGTSVLTGGPSGWSLAVDRTPNWNSMAAHHKAGQTGTPAIPSSSLDVTSDWSSIVVKVAA